jgi:uncharacterized membrane protein
MKWTIVVVAIIVIIIICCVYIFMMNQNQNQNQNSIEFTNPNSIEMIFEKYNISEKQLYNGKEWEGYRLGDIIKKYQNVAEKSFKKFPNSIGAKYYSLTKKKNELDILNQIIHSPEFIKYHSPKNTCSLHLRLGDILSKHLIKQDRYYHPISYYENHVIPQLKKYEINEIDVIAGTHYNMYLVKSMEYLLNLIIILEKHNINIKKIRLGNSPDEDFVFMCTSKYFIRSGGGYSSLICEMIKKNNGIVINKW